MFAVAQLARSIQVVAPRQVITLEQAKEMLTKWQELRGEQATKESLIVVLKKLKLNEAAGTLVYKVCLCRLMEVVMLDLL